MFVSVCIGLSRANTHARFGLQGRLGANGLRSTYAHIQYMCIYMCVCV